MRFMIVDTCEIINFISDAEESINHYILYNKFQ